MTDIHEQLREAGVAPGKTQTEELRKTIVVNILCPQFPYSVQDARRAGEQADQILQACKEAGLRFVIDTEEDIEGGYMVDIKEIEIE